MVTMVDGVISHRLLSILGPWGGLEDEKKKHSPEGPSRRSPPPPNMGERLAEVNATKNKTAFHKEIINNSQELNL